MMSYGLVGNALAFVLFVFCAIYSTMVLGHVVHWWTLDSFGTNWLADGFCLSFKPTVYHTHLLSFYVDSVCSVILFMLTLGERREEFAAVKLSVYTVFIHGLGHLYMWFSGGVGFGTEEQVGKTLAYAQYYILVPFFMLFMYKPKAWPLSVSVILSALNSVALILLPNILIFPYVNFVITVTGLAALVLACPRDVYYPLQVLTFTGPVIMAFLEPMLCDDLLINYGGHIYYDLAIPLCFVIYYLVAVRLPPRPFVYIAKAGKSKRS
jgi:lipoprotein signal peptidase